MKKITGGFTLMELLIVIGVLGILAAGLLAAIDPFEQLKKARDTNNRSAAIELLGSSQRYYATHGYLPWFKPGAGTPFDQTICPDAAWAALRPGVEVTDFSAPNATVGLSKADKTNPNDDFGCIDGTLGVDGEIKTSFFDGLATTLYIASGSKTRVVVCFAPEAKSNMSDAQTAYEVDSTSTPTLITSGCSDTARAASRCLQCFQ